MVIWCVYIWYGIYMPYIHIYETSICCAGDMDPIHQDLITEIILEVLIQNMSSKILKS